MGTIKVWDGSAWVTSSQGPQPAASQVALSAVTHLTSTDVQDAVSRLPKGILTSDLVSTSQLFSAATGVISTLSLTFTADVTRLYRVYSSLVFGQSLASQWDIILTENGTSLGGTYRLSMVRSTDINPDTYVGSLLYTPTSGSKTLTITCTYSGSGGSALQYYGTSGGVPALFYVEDVGPR